MRFRDRRDAGIQLARELNAYAGRMDVLVLGLPRGGVVVAYEVARVLHAPLDVCLVRKIGAEHIPELAVGAIASGGIQVIDEDLVCELGMSAETLEAIIARERVELERRERVYREGRQPLAPAGKTVLLVDDGIATGATVRAAIRALRQGGRMGSAGVERPAQIIVAVPVVDRSIATVLAREADGLVAVSTPMHLGSVGEWYAQFAQTSDEEVIVLLRRAAGMTPASCQ